MLQDKTPLGEFVWLMGLRQQELPLTESGSEPFDGAAPECELPDCLPWVHTVNQCERMRLRGLPETDTSEETPVL